MESVILELNWHLLWTLRAAVTDHCGRIAPSVFAREVPEISAIRHLAVSDRNVQELVVSEVPM